MRSLIRSAALCGCFVFALGTASAQQRPSAPSTNEPPVSQEDQEVQQLLKRLTELSDLITRDPQSWQHQLTQTEISFKLAARSKGQERTDWLKMGIDSLYAAAVQAPEGQPAPYKRLEQLPAEIKQVYPKSNLWSHAARMVIQADYVRALSKKDADPTRAQLAMRDRLLGFAGEHADAPEAADMVMEAAKVCEDLKTPEDAVRCYRYVVARYSGTAVARTAAGRQWRLGGVGTEVSFTLPYLYAATGQSQEPYCLSEARGKLTVVYFWSATAGVEADLDALKRLTDRYPFGKLEVVYVNLDDDGAKAREFLRGRLLNGTQVWQKGGLQSETAASFGLQALPEALLVGPDGKLLAHSLNVGQLEAAVAEKLPSKR